MLATVLQLSAPLTKSPGLVPPTVTVLMVSGAVPLLATLMVCTALALPTSWLANVSDVGVSVAAGAVPVPVSAALWLHALSVIASEPVFAPVAAGLNCTLTLQLVPAATGTPEHVSALVTKSAALAPAGAIEVMLR